MIFVECHDLHPDVVEGLESENLFYHCRVISLFLGRVALYEQAVTFVLEVPVDLIIS